MTTSLFLVSAAVLLLAGCNNVTEPVRAPIDCQTLATSLTASEPTLTTTASGLKYRDETIGTGITVVPGTVVAVYYAGCLVDGTKFNEVTNTDQPLVFRVSTQSVIAGFDEGMLGMRVGGRRQLVIPPSLGYGAQGSGPIPPNATVVFTIILSDAQ